MTSLRRTLSLVFLRRGCRHRTALWMNRGSFWFTPFSISFICSRMSARKCRVLIIAHHLGKGRKGVKVLIHCRLCVHGDELTAIYLDS